MAARYATQTFVVQLASGASHLVVEGALRDSTHAAVVAAPGLFTATPVTPASPRLAAHLAAYPAGP